MLDVFSGLFLRYCSKKAIMSRANSQEMKTKKNYRAILRVTVVHKSSKHLMLAEQVRHLNTFCLCAFVWIPCKSLSLARHHFPGSKGRVYLASLKMGFLTDDFFLIFIYPLSVFHSVSHAHAEAYTIIWEGATTSRFFPPSFLHFFHRQKKSLASAEGFVGRPCFLSPPPLISFLFFGGLGSG